jgi:Arc/MetJ-type ribon-helix-helix transcriptional regulator
MDRPTSKRTRYDSGSIGGVKLSVSMDEEDVEFLDRYAAEHSVDSRSAVVQRAIALLRSVELGDEYAAAWDEWAAGEDADLWEAAVDDGLSTSPSAS